LPSDEEEEQIRKLSSSPIFGCGLVDAPQVSTLDEHHSIFGEQQTRPKE